MEQVINASEVVVTETVKATLKEKAIAVAKAHPIIASVTAAALITTAAVGIHRKLKNRAARKASAKIAEAANTVTDTLNKVADVAVEGNVEIPTFQVES